MMLHLLPLPDEIASAYKGRLLRHNGWSNPNEAMRSLLAWAGGGGANRWEVSTVELLARVAGMDTSKFVTEHTTVPLRRAVVAEPPWIPHGSSEQGSLLWTMALRGIRPGAYFCVKCVEEDFDHHGTPYWRREHQLPGVYCCSKHGLALSYVETADAFLSSPTAFIDNHQVVSEPWVADLQKNAQVQRFLAICADLLARTQPLDELDVSRAARARAMDLDLHSGHGIVRKRLLSDLVMQRFDKAWLASVVPGLIDKQAGEYWQTVDGAVIGKRAGVGSIVYALVFSALFESADDAINAMIATTSADKCVAPQRLEARQIDEGQLRTAYIAANGSHRGVAAQLRLRESIATKRLGDLGLPPLGNLHAVSLRNTLSAVLQHDMSLSRACRKHGLALDDVKAALRGALGPLDSVLGQITGTGPRPKAAPSAPRHRPVPPPRQTAPIANATREAVWSGHRAAVQA
ncbi:MAG: TniQ family protein [Sterolibacterium sp.]|nr:TniQ family protein [Sterolibacterium sp.]